MTWMNVAISLVLPVALTLAGGIVKKLVRGTGWKASDFYFGVELAFTCVTSGIFHIIDILKPVLAGNPLPPASSSALLKAAVFIPASLIVFLGVMAFHQDHGTDDQGNERGPDKSQRLWLGVIANGAGIATLFAFLLWVKGL